MTTPVTHLLTILAGDLRTRRRAQELTQKAVAAKAKCSANTVYLLEAGLDDVKLSTLADVATGVGCRLVITLVPK